jgi:hypothetical protein
MALKELIEANSKARRKCGTAKPVSCVDEVEHGVSQVVLDKSGVSRAAVPLNLAHVRDEDVSREPGLLARRVGP